MHLKRQKVPKNWPTKRKGTKYVVRPNFGLDKGLPILIILRDVLKIAQNRKEVKRAIHLKQILLNNKPIVDEKNIAVLFDVLTLLSKGKNKKSGDKNYRVGLTSNGKFEVKEIKDSESNSKISKIVNKKVLKGKKTQLNLSDGRNFLSDINCEVNDSVLTEFKEKAKIEKCLPLKEKIKAIVFEGKHAGAEGIISVINKEKKMVEMNIKGKDKVNVLIKQLMVLE